MRKEAFAVNSWRALHDSALFAMMTADELDEVADRISAPGASVGPQGDAAAEAVLLAVLDSQYRLPRSGDSLTGDRFSRLLENRSDIGDFRKSLESGGRRGRMAHEAAVSALTSLADSLREDALESIVQARRAGSDLTGSDKAALLYIESLALKEQGRFEESRNRAAEALDADPEHARARELMELEVTS